MHEKMKLLVIEESDQDRHGIDTVLMPVPKDYDYDQAMEESSLRSPKVIDEIYLDPIRFATLSDLGFYRRFVG